MSSDSSASPQLDREQVLLLLRSATTAHKGGDLEGAIELYRRAINAHADQQACALLASLLVTSPAPTPHDSVARHAEAVRLAELAESGADAVADVGRRALLLTRLGHFYLASRGTSSNGDSNEEAHVSDKAKISLHQKAAVQPVNVALQRAVVLLERATQLDNRSILAWRNLAIAYRAMERLEDSERASRTAITAAGAIASADLLYRHGKALQRLGRVVDASERFCDVLTTDPRHELAAFWLRVGVSSVASSKTTVHYSDEQKARIEKVLQSVAAARRTHDNTEVAPAEIVPHEYVRLLFDGYASRFDEHLVEHLGYRTPSVLLAFALQHQTRKEASVPNEASPHSADGRAVWRNAADLGCGTGLCGAVFRPYVTDKLAGVDLSPAMVAIARSRLCDPSTSLPELQHPEDVRKVYDELAVGDIVSWMRSCAVAGGELYDIITCADVLVYIGPLEAVFHAAAAILAPGGLFVGSTEAMDDAYEEAHAGNSSGFRLTSTGRCAHKISYVKACAVAAGFEHVASECKTIRHNAGVAVLGDVFVMRFHPPPSSAAAHGESTNAVE